MKFVQTKDGFGGTHLQGCIVETYDRLVEIFGEPNFDGDEYKVQKEWAIKFEDGTVATIYDWKEGDCYNGAGNGKHYTKVTDWHVGGAAKKALFYVNETLEGHHTLSTDAAPRYTIEQIASAAKEACFYVTPDNQWLRMQYCDSNEGYFVAMDEESGEDYRFYYSELVNDTPEFHKLTKMAI